MDLLMKMKDVQFWLTQVKANDGTDYFFNKAKNELQSIIVDGERREREKFQQSYDGAHRDGSVV